MISARNFAKSIVRTAALVALLAAGACGGDDAHSSNASPETAARTISIEMTDIAFSPSAVTVKKDERVKFVFTNKGKLQHDAFVGDAAAQADHEREMRAAKDDASSNEGVHHGGSKSAKPGVTVQSGESDAIEIAFTETGEQIIGCHEPGHYDAGMKIIVTVE